MRSSERIGRLVKKLNAVLKLFESFAKCEPLFGLGALHRCRIFDAPVRRHRLPGPNRAHFARRVITHREDKIEGRRARRRELIPTLAAQALGGHFHVLQ
jgi:hypothetical protein